MASKSKSTLSEASNNKASPSTPKAGKILSKGVTKSDNADSPSPVAQNTRVSIDRPARDVNSKTTTITSKPAERRSPKLTTTTDKQQPRASKGPDLQAQFNLLQEDFKKAKEQLVLAEQEKEHALDELKGAQKIIDETNEKFKEALVAQKRAEDDSEIEKFRSLEMEQAGIDMSQKKEDMWRKEIEEVKKQHASDLTILLSTNQDLEKVKEELTMTCDARNQAFSHADNATKMAEIHANKAENLSIEVDRLKGLLETQANERSMISILNEKIDSLKQELAKTKCFEDKLVEREVCIEQLSVDLEASKMVESYMRNLWEERKIMVSELENRLETASQLEISTTESLVSLQKQLEEEHSILQEAQSEISALKEKLAILEVSISTEKEDLKQLELHLVKANEEASEMDKVVEALKHEIEMVKEERTRALNNETCAAANVQSVLEEKNNLVNKLEICKDEEEKSKREMESLTAALHKVSSELRESKEKVLSTQSECESYETKIDDMKSLLKTTNEKYDKMLENAEKEIDLRTKELEKANNNLENSIAEWEQKEIHLVNCVKETNEDCSAKEKEINRLVVLIKEKDEDTRVVKDEGDVLKATLKEIESEVCFLKDVLGESKAENMRMKESLLNKENELLSVTQESEEMQAREVALLEKIDELSKLLEKEATNKKEVLGELKAENMRMNESLLNKENELLSVTRENEEMRDKEVALLEKIDDLSKLLEEKAMNKKDKEENEELTDSEKDYDLLPKVVEFSEENGHACEGKSKSELYSEEIIDFVNENEIKTGTDKFEDVNSKQIEEEGSKEKEENIVEGGYKMWESCTIEEKDYSPERQSEETIDHINGSSDNVEDSQSLGPKQQLKKKKPLLQKFGSLLKKKSTSTQK